MLMFTDSMNLHVNTALEGYIPSLCSESPTHLAVIAAAISGTMYCRPPVSSNMITTNDTSRTHQTLQAYWSSQVELAM